MGATSLGTRSAPAENRPPERVTQNPCGSGSEAETETDDRRSERGKLIAAGAAITQRRPGRCTAAPSRGQAVRCVLLARWCWTAAHRAPARAARQPSSDAMPQRRGSWRWRRRRYGGGGLGLGRSSCGPETTTDLGRRHSGSARGAPGRRSWTTMISGTGGSPGPPPNDRCCCCCSALLH